MQPWVSQWSEHQDAWTQKILEHTREFLEANCQSVSIVRGSGAVVSSILEQAKALEVDLIVLGAKGRSGMSRVLLGSISDSVATRAKCSVLVVRRAVNKMHRLNSILLAYDKSVASREAVVELMQWRLSRDVHVSVTSVAQNPYIFVGVGYAMSPSKLTADQVAPIGHAAERMASQIAEHFPHTDSHTPVADHIGEAIVDAAKKANADMIVVGDKEHSQIGDFFLGSTGKYVLRHASRSVWISRRHWNSTIVNQEAKDAVTAH